ncbi:hypothetical protein HK098_000404 [Nowakowskiella sp. JEL0407]|nr:hypothetical protein HK098_000404 [Nowakowskiella sp. JEL0407]
MVSIRNETGLYTFWDLINFVLFDRWLVLFDFPTFLVLFTDQITTIRIVPFLIFCHWLFRNIGGVLFGILRYALQDSFQKKLDSWRFTTGIPTLPWYLGELCLDAYPFLKAMAVTKDRRWLQITCYAGIVPLVIVKVLMITFRYFYVFNAETKQKYFEVANSMDAAVLAVTAWSDILNSIVIVYAATENRRFVGNDFLGNLVRTTELRMVASTILSAFSVFLIAYERCPIDVSIQGNCYFKGARDISVDTAYSLYILDYLLIKFHRTAQSEKSPQRHTEHKHKKTQLHLWPAHGIFKPRETMNNTVDITVATASLNDRTTELETPSFVVLKRNIQSEAIPLSQIHSSPFRSMMTPSPSAVREHHSSLISEDPLLSPSNSN